MFYFILQSSIRGLNSGQLVSTTSVTSPNTTIVSSDKQQQQPPQHRWSSPSTTLATHTQLQQQQQQSSSSPSVIIAKQNGGGTNSSTSPGVLGHCNNAATPPYGPSTAFNIAAAYPYGATFARPQNPYGAYVSSII